MELPDAYIEIVKILKKADKDTKRIMSRGDFCAGWGGFFNVQDTRITKAGAFDKIYKIVMQVNPKTPEEQIVDWSVRKTEKKKSPV